MTQQEHAFPASSETDIVGVSVSLKHYRARYRSRSLSPLDAGGDLLYDGDVAVTSRPDAVRVLVAEALRHALARPQRRVELRVTVVVGGLVHPLGVVPLLAHAVLDVQRHVQGLRLG